MTTKWDERSLQDLAELLEDPLKGTRMTRREWKNAIVHRVLDMEKDARDRLSEFQQRICDLEKELERVGAIGSSAGS